MLYMEYSLINYELMPYYNISITKLIIISQICYYQQRIIIFAEVER